jgi:hypothetical protein
MVSRTEASSIVQAEIAKWKLDQADDELIVLEKKIEETPYAWVVYCNSKLWYETGNIEYMLFGAGPFIISKKTGEVTQYSSAYGTESALELYEEEQQLYGLRITEDLTDMSAKLLVKRLLPLTNQTLLQLVRQPDMLVDRGARNRLMGLQAHLQTQGIATEVLPVFS